MSASTHSPVLKHHFGDLNQQHASERLGMWMFLATLSGLFFGAYEASKVYVPNAILAIARGGLLHEGAAANIPVRCAGGREMHAPGRFVLVRDAYERPVGVMAVFASPDDPALAGRPLDRLD